MGGRENARTLDIYDYTSDNWTSLVDSAPVEFNHYQATEYQGLIWVIGAFKTNSFPNEAPADFIWVFDPSSQDWIQGPEIPSGRKRGSSGLVVYNDKFYIVAGNTMGHNGGYVPWFDEYDPATGIWTPLSNAPRARDHFHAMVIGDKLYAVGGRLSGGTGGVFKPVIPEVDVFDFNSGTWSTLPSGQNLPTPRAASSVANFNNKLVVIGGEVQNELVYGINIDDALKITEEYDPVTGLWTRMTDMNFERHGTQAIVSGNGIFVLGGSPNRGGGNQKNMEYFNGDAPQGIPSVASSLSAPSSVEVLSGSTTDIVLSVTDGNVGLIVSSMELSGPNADDFNIVSDELVNSLLKSNSNHTITVGLTGTGTNRSAVLTINYGNSSSINIGLTRANEAPIAIVSATPLTGEAPLQVTFTGGNSMDDIGIIDYVWSFKDGSPLSAEVNPIYIFTSAGSYDVELTVADEGGLTDTTTITITVGVPNAPPVAIAAATPLTGDAPLSVTFTGSNSTDDVGVVGYLWDFMDGSPTSTATDPIHTFTVAGTYDVELIAADAEGLTDTTIITITVNGLTNEAPVAIATATPLIGSAPLDVSFTGSNSTDDVGVVGYLWDFMDGSPTSTDADPPIHAFTVSGTYDVELTVTDGGGLTATTVITITVNGLTNEAPVAIATATPLIGDAPLDVAFTGSNSTDDVGVTGYSWDFIDGGSSMDADPIYTFTTVGTYQVSLTVGDAEGLTDTVRITIIVQEDIANGEVTGLIVVNPAKEVAEVQLLNKPAGKEIEQIHLHDANGRLLGSFSPEELFVDNTYNVPIATLRDGIYYIILDVNQGDALALKLVVRN
jgi:large repetitive protein